MLLGPTLLQQQARVAPALTFKVESQAVEQQPITLLGQVDVGVDRQILQLDRRMLGIGGTQPRRVQPQHGTLELLRLPAQPELSPQLRRLQLPSAGQSAWQPGGPVALRQAQIQLRLSLRPTLRLHARVQAQGQRLAIRQHTAPVQPQAIAIGA